MAVLCGVGDCLPGMVFVGRSGMLEGVDAQACDAWGMPPFERAAMDVLQNSRREWDLHCAALECQMSQAATSQEFVNNQPSEIDHHCNTNVGHNVVAMAGHLMSGATVTVDTIDLSA